jgi:hypothetical protein
LCFLFLLVVTITFIRGLKLLQFLPFSLQPLKMADTEDPADLFGEDDLFGDEDEAQSEQERALSDRELDSGDDEDRNDRAAEHTDDMAQQIGTHDREARIMDADFARQGVPRPTDGQAGLNQMWYLKGIH